MHSQWHSIRTLLLLCAIGAAQGCAAWSNPTTWPSIPVRRLPEELLGKSREDQVDIPQPLLRQERPKEHIIDVGDVLGIVLDTITSPRDTPPPVQFPREGALNQTIGVGYPFPVLEDGTISMPIAEPINVKGLTINEAREKIRKTYIEGNFLKPDQVKLLVTMLRPRQYRVLVVRQDTGGIPLNQQAFAQTSRRGSGNVLELPAYENDVLTALTRSGGLPGNDAKNEVLIQRGVMKGALTTFPSGPIPGIETIRIPLRLRPGEPIPFQPKDVILNDGDIMFIQSRDTELYYTGGLIPPGEYPIPRDYDLDVIKALAQTHAPIVNGALNNNNFTGTILGQGLGSASPSQLVVIRRAPGNRQIAIRVDINRALQDARERIIVQPGDVLILQETMAEAFTRYATAVIRSSLNAVYLSTPDAVGQVNITSP